MSKEGGLHFFASSPNYELVTISNVSWVVPTYPLMSKGGNDTSKTLTACFW